MDKKLVLAQLLADEIKKGNISKENLEYKIVNPLFHDKTLGALRVGVFKVLGKIPDDIDQFFKEHLFGDKEEDEQFYEKCFLILPDLIKSFM
ncbi:MAG: hypothetical protein GF308_16025 [Candidatus Heimdallarchaeota archaeon]|nr:hypothetical protein [Candidatus Heimdallarchaeota archaeon]